MTDFVNSSPREILGQSLKILFVAEIEKLLPARQPLTTTDGSWTPGLGKISKGFYTENYFPLMVNWLFFFHIRFVEVAVASYFCQALVPNP